MSQVMVPSSTTAQHRSAPRQPLPSVARAQYTPGTVTWMDGPSKLKPFGPFQWNVYPLPEPPKPWASSVIGSSPGQISTVHGSTSQDGRCVTISLAQQVSLLTQPLASVTVMQY